MTASANATCQYLTNERKCMIASCLANRPIEPWAGVCATCQQNVKPRAINQATASIAYMSWRAIGEYAVSERLYRRFLARGYFAIVPLDSDGPPRQPPVVPHGVGTIIHWILATLFRISVSAECSCMFWMREMNRQGVAWTIRNRRDITLAMLHQYRTRWPRSRMPIRLRRLGAATLLWFSVLWRVCISSRIPLRG